MVTLWPAIQPVESIFNYSDYQKDSYILSIFENQAKQTSVKGDCDGEHYDFKNQFYPFSKKETYEMLGEDWLLNDKDE